MVARGFEDLSSRMATKEDLKGTEMRIDKIEKSLIKLEETIQRLANKLANYIDLHEERYLEIRSRYRQLERWAAKVAEKTGVAFEIKEVL